MRKKPVIEIVDAVVTRNGTPILCGVSMCVDAGECVAITGPNGAGKTTLLTLINGFSKVSRGCIRVLGLSPSGGGRVHLRRQIGYVAQVQQLDSRMPITVRESVMTGVYGRLGWKKKPRRQDHELVDTVLERFGLIPLAHHPLGTLSGGEMRRAAIARAWVQDPAILLLDEPTSSLDGQARENIEQVILSAWQEGGKTILWVTHDPESFVAWGISTIHMSSGRIVQDGRYCRSLMSARGGVLDDWQRPEVAGVT